MVAVTEHSVSSFEGRGESRESVTTTTISDQQHDFTEMMQFSRDIMPSF